MSGVARLGVGAALVAISLAAWPATATRKNAASAPASAPGATRPASSPAAAPASAPTEFTGTLSAGVTYVADMAFDARALHIWRPLRNVEAGKNVAWTIVWTNLDQFPALKNAATQARPQRMRFRVVKTDMLSGSPALPWMAAYRCEVLAVEPIPVPGASVARRR